MNQPYSQEFQQYRLIDMFIPDESNGKAILFIHGGGWQNGNKTKFNDVAKYFCQKGYTCGSMSYRFAPEYRYPCQVEDARLAMAYMRKNASVFGYNENCIAAFGSSAGGHLALMLATIDSEDSLGHVEELEKLETRPAAVVLYCPVTNLHTERSLWDDHVLKSIIPFMGDAEENMYDIYTEATPLDRIKGNECPMISIHGDIDKTIPFRHSEELCIKLNASNVKAELAALKGVDHGFGYGIRTDSQKEAVKIAERFLDKYLCMNSVNK